MCEGKGKKRNIYMCIYIYIYIYIYIERERERERERVTSLRFSIMPVRTLHLCNVLADETSKTSVRFRQIPRYFKTRQGDNYDNLQNQNVLFNEAIL